VTDTYLHLGDGDIALTGQEFEVSDSCGRCCLGVTLIFNASDHFLLESRE
jgi:hypothetical protein